MRLRINNPHILNIILSPHLIVVSFSVWSVWSCAALDFHFYVFCWLADPLLFQDVRKIFERSNILYWISKKKKGISDRIEMILRMTIQVHAMIKMVIRLLLHTGILFSLTILYNICMYTIYVYLYRRFVYERYVCT